MTTTKRKCILNDSFARTKSTFTDMKKYCFSSQDLLFQILSRPHVHVIKQTEILLLNNNKTNFINDIDWAKNIWYTWRNFLCVLTDSKYTFRTIDFSSKMTRKKRWKYKEIIKSSEVPEHLEAKRTFHFVLFSEKFISTLFTRPLLLIHWRKLGA